MIRRLHPGVGLNPDFFAGMRNHGNALEAMLLYVRYLELSRARPGCMYAINNKIATQWELMAAGYNSNPRSARLSLPWRLSWRTLIPREPDLSGHLSFPR